jgi:hypothetical protein
LFLILILCIDGLHALALLFLLGFRLIVDEVPLLVDAEVPHANELLDLALTQLAELLILVISDLVVFMFFLFFLLFVWDTFLLDVQVLTQDLACLEASPHLLYEDGSLLLWSVLVLTSQGLLLDVAYLRYLQGLMFAHLLGLVDVCD